MTIYADMEPWGHGFYVYGECSAWDLIHDFLQRCHQTLGAGQFATAIGGFRKYSSFKQGKRDMGTTHCSSCGKSSNKVKLLQCSRCKREMYCDAACQKAHWKAGHKQECGKKRA